MICISVTVIISFIAITVLFLMAPEREELERHFMMIIIGIFHHK